VTDPAGSASADAPPEKPPIAIQIVRGNPSAAEVAAVTAVVTAVIEQASDEDAVPAARSAWSWSQRQLRTPLHAHAGAWRGFGG
jgi:hypothetical protein